MLPDGALLFLLSIPSIAGFVGESLWPKTSLELCDHPENIPLTIEMSCFYVFNNLHPVKLEIVNFDPILVIYRDILTATQVDGFLEVFRNRTLERAETIGPKSDARQANNTFFFFNDSPITQSISETLATSIPYINFETSEEISALSYLPGGHYVEHYDYIDYNENYTDWFFENYGNRFATVIMVFKTADEGGCTAFPVMNKSIRANPGDAFMWFNMMADEQMDAASLHSGCPVYKGEKIVATVWTRAADQPLLMNAVDPGPIDIFRLLFN
ncbi:unnamed protein product [Caenorhabditis bovis]|uniref:Fe2OG dioxygenase domain-containing protein n=1 Tax=Caenorhabditis bovis TaxID=2654633 RepID=A0A8S1EEV9_9PELO|nr:unnamed protein product [Caenorhabditis bovis]